MMTAGSSETLKPCPNLLPRRSALRIFSVGRETLLQQGDLSGSKRKLILGFVHGIPDGLNQLDGERERR